MEQPPHVECVAHKSNYRFEGRRLWVLEVECPFCKETHRHGGGDSSKEPIYGYRIANCGKGYHLIPKQGD